MQPPLIILSALHSHAILAGAMLGRHPMMQDLPPTNLWLAETVAALLDFETRHGKAMYGLIHALAWSLGASDPEEGVERAREWLEERRDWSVNQVYEHLATHADDRILVDASPWMPLKSEYMERVVRMQPDVNFLHLTRSPITSLPAMVAFPGDSADAGAVLGQDQSGHEELWILMNEQIVSFCEALPPGQCMQLKIEDLLDAPELYLTQIAEWLGISMASDAIKAMLQPELSPYHGLYPDRFNMVEAQNSLLDDGVSSKRSQRPVQLGETEWSPGCALDKPALKLAKQFGYA